MSPCILVLAQYRVRWGFDEVPFVVEDCFVVYVSLLRSFEEGLVFLEYSYPIFYSSVEKSFVISGTVTRKLRNWLRSSANWLGVTSPVNFLLLKDVIALSSKLDLPWWSLVFFWLSVGVAFVTSFPGAITIFWMCMFLKRDLVNDLAGEPSRQL